MKGDRPGPSGCRPGSRLPDRQGPAGPQPRRSGLPAHEPAGDGDWPVDPGRPLSLRLLALLGAVAFAALGLGNLGLLLRPLPPAPQRLPLPPPSGRAAA